MANLTDTETPPQLHGDGVTDDTDAVQWYLDRQMTIPRMPGPGFKVDPARIRKPVSCGLAAIVGEGYFASAAPDVEVPHE